MSPPIKTTFPFSKPSPFSSKNGFDGDGYVPTLEIPLPEFVDLEQRDIHVVWGREVVARKLRGKPVEIKMIRCSLCGKCCMNLDPKVHFYPIKPDGTCIHLKWETITHKDGKVEKGWFCRHPRGDAVPFSCCIGRGIEEECAIEFKAVE